MCGARHLELQMYRDAAVHHSCVGDVLVHPTSRVHGPAVVTESAQSPGMPEVGPSCAARPAAVTASQVVPQSGGSLPNRLSPGKLHLAVGQAEISDPMVEKK